MNERKDIKEAYIIIKRSKASYPSSRVTSSLLEKTSEFFAASFDNYEGIDLSLVDPRLLCRF
jgi:hypothetical protein